MPLQQKRSKTLDYGTPVKQAQPYAPVPGQQAYTPEVVNQTVTPEIQVEDKPAPFAPPMPEGNFRERMKIRMGDRGKRGSGQEKRALRKAALSAVLAQLGGDASKLSDRAQRKLSLVKEKDGTTKPKEDAPKQKGMPPRGPERRAYKLERKKIRRGILPRKSKKHLSADD